jgi:hypothetical protein
MQRKLVLWIDSNLWCKGNLCCELNQTCDLRVLKLIDLLMQGLSYYVMNTSRLWFFSRQFSIVMNDGGAGLLEQDAHRRGGGGAGACRAPVTTGYFLFSGKPFSPGFRSGWSPGTKRGGLLSLTISSNWTWETYSLYQPNLKPLSLLVIAIIRAKIRGLRKDTPFFACACVQLT